MLSDIVSRLIGADCIATAIFAGWFSVGFVWFSRDVMRNIIDWKVSGSIASSEGLQRDTYSLSSGMY